MKIKAKIFISGAIVATMVMFVGQASAELPDCTEIESADGTGIESADACALKKPRVTAEQSNLRNEADTARAEVKTSQGELFLHTPLPDFLRHIATGLRRAVPIEVVASSKVAEREADARIERYYVMPPPDRDEQRVALGELHLLDHYVIPVGRHVVVPLRVERVHRPRALEHRRLER